MSESIKDVRHAEGNATLYGLLSKCNSLVVVYQGKAPKGTRENSFPKFPHLLKEDGHFRQSDVNSPAATETSDADNLFTCDVMDDDHSKKANDSNQKQVAKEILEEMLLPYHSESLEKLEKKQTDLDPILTIDRFKSSSEGKGGLNDSNASKTGNLPRGRGRGRPQRRQRTKGRQPDLLFCYICGHQYGRTSLPFHERECLKKWHTFNNRRLPWCKRAIPKKIMLSMPNSVGNLTEKQKKELYWKMYLENRPSCRFCSKKFSPFKIDSHETICKKICHKESYMSPAKKHTMQTLRRRMEIANRFSLSRSPLLSLISRLKVIATEPAYFGKKVGYQKSKSRNTKRKSKRPNKSLPARVRGESCECSLTNNLPRRCQGLPKFKKPEDPKTKVEQWQLKNSWENSEEIMRLRKLARKD